MDKRLYKDLYRSQQKNHLENGIWPFTVPFGYKKVFSHTAQVYWKDKSARGYRIRSIPKYKLIPDEKELEIIQDVFATYASNLFSIKLLNEYIYNKYKVKFALESMCKILTNRFYIGEMVFESSSFPHNYKTVISNELFEKVQLIKIQNESRRWKSANCIKFAYRGLISCLDHKNYVLSPEMKKKRYIYYSCPVCKPRKCISENVISTSLVSSFDEIIIPQEFIDSLSGNLKEFFKVFKENYKEWFLKNYEQRQFIVRFLFKNLWWDKGSLKFIFNSPFDGKNYQDFLIEELKKVITIFGFNVADEEMSDESSLFYLLQVKHSTNDLLEKLSISLSILQEQLMDLHLKGKIECDEFGYWKTR